MQKNYFKTFQIEEKFHIDEDDLERRYLSFQRNFHPDKAGVSEIEKSILVNEGYDVLKDKSLRAGHILKLHGIDVENDEKAPRPDLETLSEILEIREKILDLSQEEKNQLKKELTKNVNSCLEEVGKMLDGKEFEKASQVLIKAKYLGKTLKDLKKEM